MASEVPGAWSDQTAELVRSEAGGLGNGSHRDGVDGIVARYHEAGFAVGHDDMAALTRHLEAEFLKDPNCHPLTDAG